MKFSTVVDKQVLLERVRQNRDEHERKYNEAVEAFWVKVTKFSEATLSRIEGRDPAFLAPPSGLGYAVPAALLIAAGACARPAPPPCHLEDYDRALDMLDMLGMHQGTEIELGSQDVARLVRDQWDWKDEFMGSYAGLTG